MNNQDNTKSSPVVSPLPAKAIKKLSETSSSSPVIVPTPSVTSEPDDISLRGNKNMETSQENVEPEVFEDTQKIEKEEEEVVIAPIDKTKVTVTIAKRSNKKSNRPTKKSKRKVDDTSASDVSDSDSESESADSSDDEKAKRKRKRKLAAKRAAAKKKLKAKAKSKRNKSKKYNSTSEADSSEDSSDSDTDSDSDYEVEDKKSRRKALRAKAKKRKSKKHESSSDESDSDASISSSSSDSDSEDEKSKRKRAKAKARRKSKKSKKVDSSSSSESSSAEEDALAAPADLPASPPLPGDDIDTQVAKVSTILKGLQLKQAATLAVAGATKLEKLVKKNALEFKRVDQVYDMKIRDWKLVESNTDQKDEFDCVFTVRRRLDWEGKYKETQVDIKSKVLRNALQEVFKECKSISLVEDTPQIDPHTLFHYYDEIKTYVKKTLKPKLRKARKSKQKKKLTQEIAQCKLLLSYIDEDYNATRKALKPMLKAGTITYDLVWALFKPNTIVFTPTYGNKDDPRCFKVDFSYEYESWMTGIKSCVIDGRYLEYDGKTFGLGDHQVMIQAFKGHKKITSLAAYPLKYHKDPEGIKKQLIERGMKFVMLQGMNYRLQKGIAYMKHKNSIIRFNINGRVMIDPAIFRRINPNYSLSYIKHDELDHDEEEEEDDGDDEDCCCGSDEDSDEEKEKDKMRLVMWKDKKGKKHPIRVLQSVIDKETGDKTDKGVEGDEDGDTSKNHVFTEEELLIASPVVLGFAFSEKLWLEFSLSGIDEIKWNDEAFDSLVLPDRIKQNLKGLVSSHRFNAAKTIDDVIQGKGKGLNVVLHGPPGVGKTLTGESIAEYLKCPLYAVSAGELGTNSRSLEQDLNRIMDITHSWGAILLLDEADVFLEARQPHDIHRNSLVSVFLRLTEYYQGILFLTTNRVETFDEAFQSRIHMGIRYENLSAKARKKIWMHHVGKVEQMAEQKKDEKKKKLKPFTEADYDELSKRVMNGRQIKNMVKTSQSIALAEKASFSMEHVKRVLEVAEAFEDDMRGGKGYRDAMRQYT
ncbi:Nn.00g028920.m01.CDS01 [Neocucurbitaria sp. VM-36]